MSAKDAAAYPCAHADHSQRDCAIMQPADLIIYNAHVFTANDAQPDAEAVVVRGNKITFVGSSAEALTWRTSHTRVVDGNGRSLLPGFIDTHFHLAWGSQKLDGVQLAGVATMAELATAVHAWLAENSNADWVAGYGLSYGLPTPDEPLTRHHLDQIVHDRPFVLYTYDVHSLFANSAALQQANIIHGAPHPLANGEVVVGADGLATGELYEEDATRLIRRVMPEPDGAATLRLIQKGLALAAAHGITSMHNMDGDLAQGKLYAALEEQNALTLRLSLPYWVKPKTPLAEMQRQTSQMRQSFSSDKLRAGGVKFFMDGVYESYTAVTLDAYPDQPHNFGEPIWDASTFAKFATAADALGLQIAVHACGNGAVRRVLDGYEAAQKVNGRRDSRHRVEHIEMVHPADLPRFAQLGVIAAMQPLHAPDSAYQRRRLAAAHCARKLAARLRLANSAPGRGHPGVWQRLAGGVAESAAGHCRRRQPPAVAGQRRAAGANPRRRHLQLHPRRRLRRVPGNQLRGSFKPGFLADLVLLSDNIFAIPPQEIGQLAVDLTVCDGCCGVRKGGK
jgi:predicted amidohydrolase YtcJ